MSVKQAKFMLIGLFLVLMLVMCAAANAACLDTYKRSHFGGWLKHDVYADTRQASIANAILYDMEVVKGRVTKGKFLGVYTGSIIDIETDAVDGEHIISLSFAFDHGANCWSRKLRRQFSNDLLNVIPVSASANRRKGKRVFDYLPANLGYCSDYLARIKSISEKYPLKYSQAEIKRFNLLVKKCREWRNGILIEKQKRWYEGWFE